MDQHYYKLIEDYSKKTISSEDLTSLLHWVDSSAENQQIFRETLQAFELADQFLNVPLNQAKSWAAIQQQIESSSIPKKVGLRKLTYSQYLYMAAAVLFFAVLPVLYIFKQQTKQSSTVAYHEIYNPKGQKRLVTMPDGSVVYLNGDSKIRYNINFNKGKRIVYLEGEAFFDVQHRPKQPFIVYTGAVSTTVLGTSFNINAYSSSKNIAVTVQTGKVGVLVKQKGKGNTVQFLLPNEQLTIDKRNGESVKEHVNALDYHSWREYKLFFYNQNLEQIAEVLEREYDMEILVNNSALNDVKLTAKFDKCAVNQVMEILAKLSHSKYKIYQKKVIIY
ncbi:FecR family protein [Pedobacter sp. MW01-1-1]|uniref:FecR family protein n=1 Tax=Pedobacter sp. MW01-1-1 TaxID=3383027 RepID=UPI003FEE79F8